MNLFRQYLEKYSERTPSFDEGRRFGHVLVIPSFGESESLLRALDSVPAGPLGDVLAIVVVNAAEDSPDWVHEVNREILARLRGYSFQHGSLCVIDRATPGLRLPRGQGVGLARKIGADLALRIHAAGRIESSWIHCTDADVKLPAEYFDRARDWDLVAGVSALVYPFDHENDPAPLLSEAMDLYETYLRYYLLGLAHAGSPYAFHTIGSLIGVRASAYAQVRGFPKRLAGEDFYILNKLAKVGAIARLGGPPILVQGRGSTRVPFGTGKALSQIVPDLARRLPYRVYHPAIFEDLSLWIRLIDDVSEQRGRIDPRSRLAAPDPSGRLRHVLDQMGAFDAIENAAGRSRDSGTMLRHLHTWFDAFRTLKFVHALRDTALPSISIDEALRSASFIGSVPESASPGQWRRVLWNLDQTLGPGPVGVSKIGCTFVQPKTD